MHFPHHRSSKGIDDFPTIQKLQWMSLTSCLYYPSETPLHSPQCFYNLHGHTLNLIWIIASLPSLSALYQTGIIDFEQRSV